jgi:hypothetical protein
MWQEPESELIDEVNETENQGPECSTGWLGRMREKNANV